MLLWIHKCNKIWREISQSCLLGKTQSMYLIIMCMDTPLACHRCIQPNQHILTRHSIVNLLLILNSIPNQYSNIRSSTTWRHQTVTHIRKTHQPQTLISRLNFNRTIENNSLACMPRWVKYMAFSHMESDGNLESTKRIASLRFRYFHRKRHKSFASCRVHGPHQLVTSDARMYVLHVFSILLLIFVSSKLTFVTFGANWALSFYLR